MGGVAAGAPACHHGVPQLVPFHIGEIDLGPKFPDQPGRNPVLVFPADPRKDDDRQLEQNFLQTEAPRDRLDQVGPNPVAGKNS